MAIVDLFTFGALAFLIGLVLTPVVRKLCVRLGFVDHPDGERKMQHCPIALGGGIAVFLAVFLSYAVGSVWFEFNAANPGPPIWAILAAGIISLGVGLLDDLIHLTGVQKLAGLLLAATLLIFAGPFFHHVSIFSQWSGLGPLAVPVSILFLVMMSNAINLIDGADGMAASVSIVTGIGVAIILLLSGQIPAAALTFAIVGSLAAFLVFNLPPASTFLGDGGSLSIGMMTGSLLMASTAGDGQQKVSIPVLTALCFVPLLDVVAAVVRRRLTGRSIFSADRGHLHHCLERRGIRGMYLPCTVFLFCAVSVAGGVVSYWLENDLPALMAVLVVAISLPVTRCFGVAESRLLLHSATRIWRNLILFPSDTSARNQEQQLQMIGSRDWQHVWETVREFAEKHQINRASLTIHLTWMDEEYHAVWDGTTSRSQKHIEFWRLTFPITSTDRTLGRFDVRGEPKSFSDDCLMGLGELLENLAAVLEKISQERPASVTLDHEHASLQPVVDHGESFTNGTTDHTEVLAPLVAKSGKTESRPTVKVS